MAEDEDFYRKGKNKVLEQSTSTKVDEKSLSEPLLTIKLRFVNSNNDADN